MNRFFVAGSFGLAIASGSFAQSWVGYGGNAQHTAQFNGASQTLTNIHWQGSMDDDPGYYPGVIFAHFASPMVSPANTVVYSHRQTTQVNNQSDYDNWWMYGTSGTSGTSVFSFHSDYSAALIWPNDWTTICPMCLAPVGTGANATTAGVIAGAGGSVFARTSVDATTSTANRFVFYTTVQNYLNNAKVFATVKIVTPLTPDTLGNVYFGYECGTPVIGGIQLGSGGVARVNVNNGATCFCSVQRLGVDSSIIRPSMNAAPALSNDGKSVYYGMTGNNGGFLVKLNALSFQFEAQAHLMDPSVRNGVALCIDESSASPMVGPDGHVFYGVFRNQDRESHGFLLQFDGNLNPNGANGKMLPPGGFGWDDTPSIVPASCVPSYTGTSSYLLLCKYNNYDDNSSDPGANGWNQVAVVDPTDSTLTRDRISGIHVMDVILSIYGPNHTNTDPAHVNACYEWCINSAVIDIPKKSAIVNSEDGHVYRWDFTTNKITEALNLQPPTSEAYTSTVIGPDGTIFAMNNTILFAIGN